MLVEFDTDKDRENRRKHGVSLAIGRAVLENSIHEKIDLDSSAEEPMGRLWTGRWKANGLCLYDEAARIPGHFGAACHQARGARMPIVKVTQDMLDSAIAEIDWARIDAMTDEDIKRQIAENPDAAPLPSAQLRLVWRMKSSKLSTKYKVRLLRRALRMTRAEFGEAFGIPERTLQHWEQGTREPDEASLSYLAVIADMPERVRRVHRGRLRKAG